MNCKLYFFIVDTTKTKHRKWKISNRNKNHTRVKKVGNFFFALIDELEKQIIIKKTVEVGH